MEVFICVTGEGPLDIGGFQKTNKQTNTKHPASNAVLEANVTLCDVINGFWVFFIQNCMVVHFQLIHFSCDDYKYVCT